MRSASNYSFAVAPSVQMPRSSFKRDRTYKTAFDSGYLVPFFADEVYPGDTFNGSTVAFARLSTPVVPFMDNLHMDFFYFFVPYRLLWDHWKNMMGEQDNPSDSTDYLTPLVESPSAGWSVGSLADYFGIPVEKPISTNCWLFRAYNKIYNDHFRDENLIDSIPENRGDGPDSADDYVLRKRGKRWDYLTGCLPWPQKGPGASIGLAGDAPVHGDINGLRFTDGTTSYVIAGRSGGTTANGMPLYAVSTGSRLDVGATAPSSGLTLNANHVLGVRSASGNSGLVADLSEAASERWAELRYGSSKITGKLRSGVAQSLDVWHLAQHFTTVPTLSQQFIEENPPLKRVLAVQDEPEIIFDSLTTCNTVRCLPTYSVPGLVDHF
ncbi:unnamed protein product [Cylicocyclus nassatus]|uniref:Major capsid protein n=2 Tax=Cylicocyclus nassatus TaxID=53992 RepID=A0AA36GQN5_CYLNA|nr:unnamed protein product [Cylicocyclus nassatus]CAJ0596423.1 unnamed protein product [Cylicocyclus nassatus]